MCGAGELAAESWPLRDRGGGAGLAKIAADDFCEVLSNRSWPVFGWTGTDFSKQIFMFSIVRDLENHLAEFSKFNIC